MNQSFDALLQVVQRALSEVVLPAVATADKHVVEQLHLSLAALGFVRARLGDARAFSRRELEDYLGLAKAVIAVTSENQEKSGFLHKPIIEGESLLANPVAGAVQLIACTRKLREGVAVAVEASEGSPYEAVLDGLILAHEGKMQLRARAWCEPFGFELSPLGSAAKDW